MRRVDWRSHRSSIESTRRGRPADAPVVAVAGIASPERFQRRSQAPGWTVARFDGIRDHHRYHARLTSRAIGRTFGTRARPASLTTEKDAVSAAAAAAAAVVPIAAVPLDGLVEPATSRSTRWLVGAARGASRVSVSQAVVPPSRRVRPVRSRRGVRARPAGRVGARARHGARSAVLRLSTARHRRLARRAAARGVSDAVGRRVPRDRARRRSCTSAGCSSRCCEFSTLTPDEMRARRRSRGRGSRARGAAAARAPSSSPDTSASGSCTALRARRWCCRRSRVLARPLDNPLPARSARAHAARRPATA